MSCVFNLPTQMITVNPAATKCHKSVGPGKLVDATDTFALVTGSTVTLPNSALISGVEILASSFRDSLYNVYWKDGANPKKQLASTIRTTGGDPTYCCKLDCEEFTTGAAGVQTLFVEARVLKSPDSDIDASLRCQEIL